MSPTDEKETSAVSRESAASLTVRTNALRDELVTAGLITQADIEHIISEYETEVLPRNGARVIARAWMDEGFRLRLLNDATAAAKELGIEGIEGRRMVAVENTADVHNVVVCTQCSCTAWPLLGLPPDWYKSPPYRSRVVREARVLLREMGFPVPLPKQIRVWDTTGEIRYIVVPERPQGTASMSEEQLANLVTRESMIGVAPVHPPRV